MLCGCFPLAIGFTFGSVYMSMPLSHFVPASPSPSPCPQVHSLRLCLCSCPAHRFFRTSFFFLDSIYMCDHCCLNTAVGACEIIYPLSLSFLVCKTGIIPTLQSSHMTKYNISLVLGAQLILKMVDFSPLHGRLMKQQFFCIWKYSHLRGWKE